MYRSLALATSLVGLAHSQKAGTLTAETHPSMSWQKCTAPGACTTFAGKVVLDSKWRWLHTTSGTDNCYDGNEWVASLCPDNAACTENCALDGAEYSGIYGFTAGGDSLTLKLVTEGPYSKNIGSRLYLMESDTAYQQFELLDNEFTFDVDVSGLPCGLNRALYFVSMDADGGTGKYPTNTAGAKYGTGYCDAQCPRDLKFINGEANAEGWTSSSNDVNAGVGDHGSCCAEMDIWEANSLSTAVTPHSCEPVDQTRCTGDECGGTYGDTRYAGNCDPDGCDFRMGNESFYGDGLIVDTSKVMTVVTQFIGNPLTEIKRFYVQDGVVIPNSESNIAGVSGNSITTEFCDAQKAAFGDEDPFKAHGGMASMGSALGGGMTLVMSIWNDHYANMLWLDSTYPIDETGPGGPRGSCATDSGYPAEVEAQHPDAQVTFSNIKFGPIGSTFESA